MSEVWAEDRKSSQGRVDHLGNRDLSKDGIKTHQDHSRLRNCFLSRLQVQTGVFALTRAPSSLAIFEPSLLSQVLGVLMQSWPRCDLPTHVKPPQSGDVVGSLVGASALRKDLAVQLTAYSENKIVGEERREAKLASWSEKYSLCHVKHTFHPSNLPTPYCHRGSVPETIPHFPRALRIPRKMGYRQARETPRLLALGACSMSA